MGRRTRAATAGYISVLLLAASSACAGGSSPSAEETSRSTSSTDAGQRTEIPAGTYTRVATRHDGLEMGLPEDLVDGLTGQDGELPIELEIGAGEYVIRVTNDAKISEVGDRGEYAYDADGRLRLGQVTSGGRVLAYDWTIEQGSLTLTPVSVPGEEPPMDDERFVTEGVFTLEDG